jgi:hypothetical protein
MALVSIAAARVPAAPAQDPVKPAFPAVFPAPTGANGYEEIVMAADLAAAAEARMVLTGPEVTLTSLRAALRDPERIRAIELLRAGLRKPISSPARPQDPDALQPELQHLRSLARLLAANIRAAFADGRNADALGYLSTGIRFAAALHGETLIASLVGVAVHSIVLRTYARYLTQLSANDCDRLLEVVRSMRRLPDPARLALEAERRHVASRISSLRRDASALRAYLAQPEGAAELPDLPDQRAVDAFVNQVLTEINLAFGQRIAEAARPRWQRREMPPEESGRSVGSAFVAVLLEPLAAAMTRFDWARTELQLLGVQAAIRRNAWEHQRLPSSLEELGLGEMMVDPFTGKPLVYRVTGQQTYEVYSVGTEGTTSGRRVDIVEQARTAAPSQ